MTREEWNGFLQWASNQNGGLDPETNEKIAEFIDRLKKCSVVEWQVAKKDASEDAVNEDSMPVLCAYGPERTVHEFDVTEIFKGDIFASMPWAPEEL